MSDALWDTILILLGRARCAVKTIKHYDIHGKRKQVMPICTGGRTFAGKLTMMACPERAYEMFTTSQTSVHSDSAFRKHELAGRTLISSCHPEPGKQNLLASAICFNFYWKLRFI